MQEVELFKVFLEPINRTAINYMVTGSVASMVYGQPRMTHDIDLVISLHPEQISDVIKQFPSTYFYCPSMDTIKIESSRESRGHFNLIHHKTGLKADIYLTGKDKLQKWAMSNRVAITLFNIPIWLAPIEYVIVLKLQYYKEGSSSKHLSDIKNMLVMSADRIQTQKLDELITEFGLSAQWQMAKDY